MYRTEVRTFARQGGMLLGLVMLLLAGCDTANMETEERVVAGVDLDALFAPPQADELQAVRNDWAARDVSVQNLEVVQQDTIALGSTARGVYRVVSHTVAGVRHFGAIVVPVGADPESLPLVLYTHGGDDGDDLDFTISLLSLGLSSVIDQFVYVAPSFRSEFIKLDGMTYQSEGDPSPWDYDVDDALALMNAALETTPEVDPTRIGVFGFSRGAAVGLLMSIRDPRIDLVVEFFGPTDFSASDVQETTANALRGNLRELPGLDFMNEMYIQPLKNGTLSMAEARLALIRRSAVNFAEDLPLVQIQHGDADETVSVEHGRNLEKRLQDLGRGPGEFESHFYSGAGHNPLEMTGSFDRMIEFVSRAFLAM